MKKLLALLVILLCGCSGTKISVEHIPVQPVHDDGTINVYFCPEEDCAGMLAERIRNSKKADCALFELSNKQVISALNSTNSRIVADWDNRKGLENLSFVRFDERGDYSHNKFCVLDDRIVWTGSFNPTEKGGGTRNNVVIAESVRLAENYERKFEELWGGRMGTTGAMNPVIYLDGIEIMNLFCPEDECRELLLEEIGKANTSVYFMVFSFTDKGIADKVLEKKLEGRDVKGVVEDGRINMKGEMYKYLNESGVEVHPYDGKGLMHSKVFIIDNETVITGSFNPTKSADEGNDENILMIRDAGIAKLYLNELARLSG